MSGPCNAARISFMKKQLIIEQYPDETFMFADGFDDAIIGVESLGMRVVYDIDGVLDILQKRDEMGFDEAQEFFEFNVLGAYVGEKTPLFVDQFERYAS